MLTIGQAGGTAMPGESGQRVSVERNEFALERYRYILQQIHAVNENAYRFLAIYQTLATTLVGAALTLFVGYRKWEVTPATARGGVIGILILVTMAAAFTVMLIVVGAVAWLDYRNEECDVTDEMVGPGFRKRPRPGNLLRWYETYVLLFIIVSMITMWILAESFILPAMR
ncbi:hypothetical protein OG879_11565 [Streptomyces caniferus]|nr:hypothetical protein [Streptomyces caniferus]